MADVLSIVSQDFPAEIPEFNNELLRSSAQVIIDNTVKAASNLKYAAIAFARVAANKKALQEDGLKTVQEYGALLGFKTPSTITALTAAGKIYIDERIPDQVKALPPSNVRELMPILKKGGDAAQLALINDAESVANMKQAEIRDYAKKAVAMASAGQLVGENASVLNPQDNLTGEGDSLPAIEPEPTKPGKLFRLQHISGESELHYHTADLSRWIFDFTGEETMGDWKDALAECDFKVISMGKAPTEINGNKPLLYAVMSPFNEIGLFAAVPVVSEPVKGEIVQPLTTDQMGRLGAAIVAGTIDLDAFNLAVKTGVMPEGI